MNIKPAPIEEQIVLILQIIGLMLAALMAWVLPWWYLLGTAAVIVWQVIWPVAKKAREEAKRQETL
jgi:hypothetical protein